MSGPHIYDRVRETTTTTGTGTLTLAGAVSGFLSFATVGDGNSCYYAIAHQTAAEWEVGVGTYTSSGTTLSRTTILASSNSGSAVSFAAGTKDVFVTAPAANIGIPSGTVQDFAGATVPPGWLDCDGSAVSRTTYALLFAAIGTTWGSGNGSTTFNIPDLRGRASIGAGTGSGLTARTLAATGGEEAHALTSGENGPHTHTLQANIENIANGTSAQARSYANISNQGTDSDYTGGSSGSGTAHNNMQPFAVLKKIIKT